MSDAETEALTGILASVEGLLAFVKLAAEAKGLREQNERFREQAAAKDALLLAQAERIAAQSDLLSRRAEARRP